MSFLLNRKVQLELLQCEKEEVCGTKTCLPDTALLFIY